MDSLAICSEQPLGYIARTSAAHNLATNPHHWNDLASGAGEEHLIRAGEVLWTKEPFLDLQSHLSRKLKHDAAAKAINMPAANVERAIKRGTGEVEGANYEETRYEGYATGGVAVLVEIATDNKNRTAGEIRHAIHTAETSRQ